ncbi:conserved hypothetical protein [Parafrankia sp. Ea1.12]|nr:conserved hypothetical protein [Parafrankia sp. Ea1.12]
MACRFYAIADEQVTPVPAEPTAVFCLYEFGPLNLQPRPDGTCDPGSGDRLRPGYRRRGSPWR